jgi:hypothetical protein
MIGREKRNSIECWYFVKIFIWYLNLSSPKTIMFKYPRTNIKKAKADICWMLNCITLAKPWSTIFYLLSVYCQGIYIFENFLRICGLLIVCITRCQITLNTMSVFFLFYSKDNNFYEDVYLLCGVETWKISL